MMSMRKLQLTKSTEIRILINEAIFNDMRIIEAVSNMRNVIFMLMDSRKLMEKPKLRSPVILTSLVLWVHLMEL